jgi:hypothetical protein
MMEYGLGTPLKISDRSLWKGEDKTNGFVMKGDRVPVLRNSFSKFIIGADNILLDDGVITWGNGVWRNNANIATQPNTFNAQAPSEKAKFIGILEFNQEWQNGNPVVKVVNWGVPAYSKANIVYQGLVGYKVSLKQGADIADNISSYYAYLKGNRSAEAVEAIETYKDWTSKLASATTGSRLCLFFENTTGFPVITAQAEATLTGATFAGYAELYEPENEAVYFNINSNVNYDTILSVINAAVAEAVAEAVAGL